MRATSKDLLRALLQRYGISLPSDKKLDELDRVVQSAVMQKLRELEDGDQNPPQRQ